VREIILDTETTGLDPDAGHRIVEVGCIELLQRLPSGRQFQKYVNPERDMPEEAQAVHGLTTEFLAGQPKFVQIVEEFLEFIADAPLVIHNAQFDLKFLNAELTRLGKPAIEPARAVDTVVLARQRFPGAQASLDALCRRVARLPTPGGRLSGGALLDCQLLADVYLELSGGRQPGFDLDSKRRVAAIGMTGRERPTRPVRPHEPTAEERAAHEALLARMKDPVWRQ
jgi:DNA polymerase-3 subunit epsilon